MRISEQFRMSKIAARADVKTGIDNAERLSKLGVSVQNVQNVNGEWDTC